MTSKSLFLTLVVIASIGCGSEGNAPPPQAMQPRKQEAERDPSKPWTKEEKLEAIRNAPIPEDQKKAAIAKVDAGDS